MSWLKAITTCRFDLDVGQVCEHVIGGPLGEKEKKLAAYMAFPDSNIFAGQDQYDACFAFRFPKRDLESSDADTNWDLPTSSGSTNGWGFRPASRTEKS